MYLRSFAKALLKSSDVFSSTNASPLGLPSLEKVKHTPLTFPTMSQSGNEQRKMEIVFLFIQRQNATKDAFSLSFCIPEKKEATSSCVHDQGKPRIRTTYPSSF